MKARKTRTFKALCKGGPFANQELELTSMGTTPFQITVHGIRYTGRYDGSMNWVSSEQQTRN